MALQSAFRDIFCSAGDVHAHVLAAKVWSCPACDERCRQQTREIREGVLPMHTSTLVGGSSIYMCEAGIGFHMLSRHHDWHCTLPRIRRKALGLRNIAGPSPNLPTLSMCPNHTQVTPAEDPTFQGFLGCVSLEIISFAPPKSAPQPGLRRSRGQWSEHTIPDDGPLMPLPMLPIRNDPTRCSDLRMQPKHKPNLIYVI